MLKDTLVETRKALGDVTQITAGKDGLISIAVDGKNPARAADLANAYVEELDRLTQRLAVTEASQRRLFFERESKAAREKLASAEIDLRQTQGKTRLIQPEGQSKAIFDSFAELRARVAAKEVDAASMAAFATAQNPGYVRAQEELINLRRPPAKLAKGQELQEDFERTTRTKDLKDWPQIFVQFGLGAAALKVIRD